MMNIEHELFLLQDTGYAAFQGNLTPGISKESVIGVRVPVLRDFAKKVKKDEACEQFLENLPHKYYDENMLHAVLLSAEKSEKSSSCWGAPEIAGYTKYACLPFSSSFWTAA